MKAKTSITMLALGAGSVLMYQNIKNGNLQKMVRKMNKKKSEVIDNLEEMM